MYQVKCDDYPFLDLRDEDLILVNPRVKVEVNTVGEGSFVIYENHPYYHKLKILKSIVEVSDEIGVIFRGRATENTRDFYKGKAVDLEGVMAFFNDSTVCPYKFPDDWIGDAGYTAAAENGNVVEFFLNWLIEQHNAQVQDFQKFKLGTVTVSDPNNYITREDSGYPNTWEVLKSKLFESSLGGYLCIRYEEDGNYIDYLSDFTLTNTQGISFDENLLDLLHKTDATSTYSAIIPIGSEIEIEVEAAAEGDETETTIIKKKLSLESIEDGAITEDIYKVTLGNGLHALYSKRAVEEYGWICAPVSETTWEDVKEAQNLLNKGVEWFADGVMLADTVECTAIDLHFTDDEIRSFRIYRKINVKSLPHGIEETYNLTKLDIDILNPQNTKITVGETKLTLTDQNSKEHSDNMEKIQEAFKDIEENRTQVTETKYQTLTQITEVINTCNEIILGALESYEETLGLDSFKETVETQLSLLADQMSLRISEVITEIENVNGDLQQTVTTLTKHFDFTLEDGLIIKVGENTMQIQLDNDIISFKQNGEQFGWWDGVDFHTGNIIVEVNERAQFGNFAFIPRSDGSLMFLKVGD